MFFKKAGFRKTNQGKKRVYKCMVCNRRFTPDSPFLKMRFDPKLPATKVAGVFPA